jgi:hypothetical protein
MSLFSSARRNRWRLFHLNEQLISIPTRLQTLKPVSFQPIGRTEVIQALRQRFEKKIFHNNRYYFKIRPLDKCIILSINAQRVILN